VSAVRNGPFWKDSVIFITYDEHGGTMITWNRRPHVRTKQNPRCISPGQCADLSNPPLSEEPGGRAECQSRIC